jgi:hypothetical protein
MKIGKVIIFISLFLILCRRGEEKKVSLLSPSVPKPLDIFLLLDHSSSMKLTDPQNNRIEASKFLINYLALYWTKEQDHRVGLINFGDLKPSDPSDEMTGLVSLDTAKSKEREELLNKIKPLDLRYTKFIDAFRKAKRGFSEAEMDKPRQKAIILLTDGEPDDPRKLSREAYFNEILTFFTDSLKDCRLCVIAIDKKDQYWSQNEPFWRRIAQYTQRLASAEERELKEVYWKVVSTLLEGEAEKWDSIPPEGLKIELDPYLEMVTFTIHKELPEAEVAIFTPNGKKISEEPPEITKALKTPRTEVWKIEEPQAGVWTCQIEKGRGRVEVGTTKIPVEPRLIYPKETHPQGKPFVIWASFLRKDGKPIKEHRAYKLKMWADLRYPQNFTVQHLDLFETPQMGIFNTKETIKTKDTGEYQVILYMKAHKEISEAPLPIKVVRMPYIEVLTPKDNEVQPWHKNIKIEVTIKLGEESINPTEYFIDHPNALLFYQIFDEEKNEVIKSGHFQYLGGEKESRFLADAGKIKKNGRYRLIVRLRGKRTDGSIYEYTTNPNGTLIWKKMDLCDFIIYRFYTLLLIIILILFLIHYTDIYLWNQYKFWIIGCPKLVGSVEILTEEGSTTVTLSGKRKVRIGRNGKLSFLQKGGDLIFFARREKSEEGIITEKGFVKNRVRQITQPLEENFETEIEGENFKYKIKYNPY